uniref:Uncharacterized protein n=1 Tax=Chrysotila carterae TaxID=13221 RepID=A0A7S4AXN5_CHRCT|mmetsp:Transcript_33917/g.74432  ORF Transcript_33917/g.74432 Transcript_33917/m.74432 type:complete len:211 (+) Transcript_33917:747-1379(+)|eukprot:6177249-Pleurochrysis_carterae.AAC.1
MNVVDAQSSTPAGDQTKIATEHFRSTGIRDADEPQEDLFSIFASKADTFDRWTSTELIEAIGQFDHEQNSDVLSNDVFEPARPMDCAPGDSGLPQCDSALYGSITNLLKEFGTPTGDAAQMVKTDMRRLWMAAQYPPDFAARSPRRCYDATAAAEHGGCGVCFDEALSAGDFNPGIVGVPFEVQRYCRCLLIHAEAAREPFSAFCLPEGM